MGGMPSAIRQIVAESGWGKLYEGLPSILFRQISFGMMKFLVFDFFTGKPLRKSISALFLAVSMSELHMEPPPSCSRE